MDRIVCLICSLRRDGQHVHCVWLEQSRLHRSCQDCAGTAWLRGILVLLPFCWWQKPCDGIWWYENVSNFTILFSMTSNWSMITSVFSDPESIFSDLFSPTVVLLLMTILYGRFSTHMIWVWYRHKRLLVVHFHVLLRTWSYHNLHSFVISKLSFKVEIHHKLIHRTSLENQLLVSSLITMNCYVGTNYSYSVQEDIIWLNLNIKLYSYNL